MAEHRARVVIHIRQGLHGVEVIRLDIEIVLPGGVVGSPESLQQPSILPRTWVGNFNAEQPTCDHLPVVVGTAIGGVIPNDRSGGARFNHVARSGSMLKPVIVNEKGLPASGVVQTDVGRCATTMNRSH